MIEVTGTARSPNRQWRACASQRSSKRVPFADRDAMKKLVDPVMAAYAKEIGADKIFAAINDMK